MPTYPLLLFLKGLLPTVQFFLEVIKYHNSFVTSLREKYELDMDIATSIEEQFTAHVAGMDKKSSAYDLACIAFIGDVNIANY